jgi:hypothetical protein
VAFELAGFTAKPKQGTPGQSSRQNAASKGARFGVHFTQIMSFSEVLLAFFAEVLFSLFVSELLRCPARRFYPV